MPFDQEEFFFRVESRMKNIFFKTKHITLPTQLDDTTSLMTKSL